MERLLSGTDKIILDPGSGAGGQGVVPYLSLDQNRPRPAQPQQPQTQQPQAQRR
jgi:membrane protease subunit HflK